TQCLSHKITTACYDDVWVKSQDFRREPVNPLKPAFRGSAFQYQVLPLDVSQFAQAMHKRVAYWINRVGATHVLERDRAKQPAHAIDLICLLGARCERTGDRAPEQRYKLPSFHAHGPPTSW